MKDSGEARYSAPALEKGLDILEFLAGCAAPCSKTEIAEALGRTSSEIYRMLSVLERRGYVRKPSGTSSFGPSLKLFQLGHLQGDMSTLRRAIRLPMEQLADQIGEACHFSIQHGNDLLVIMERMPSRRVCLAVGEGTALPLTQTASGNVLLSLLVTEEFEAVLEQDPSYQSLSKAKQKACRERIGSIRGTGYESAQSQLSPGVIDIAFPVGIAGTDLLGALAVSQLGIDLGASKITKSLAAIQACVNQINLNLGI